MLRCLWKLWNDDAAALVSIELILIVTIAVLSLVVGWSEVAHAVNTELDDISNAIGHFNQSYFYSGFGSYKLWGGLKSSFRGSAFIDLPDDCDGNCSGYSSITCFGAGVGAEGCGGFGTGVGAGGGYGTTIDQRVTHPGPAPIESGIPCQSPDCLPDSVVPGAGLAPVPDSGPYQPGLPSASPPQSLPPFNP